MGIELIPPTLPTFDIFKHELVSPAEILTEEERERILKFYHSEPYQFPWIKASDPVSIILGARPGDILKITANSETAGTYVSYRYVI
ncbi:MAG: DNA-directed RNA polymerase subunit H [Candidatus Bathyarchaeota archaeon]|nr:DNA-directed RNA polymerase subunit H [Candidatus Bathyarchaeota archaeon]